MRSLRTSFQAAFIAALERHPGRQRQPRPCRASQDGGTGLFGAVGVVVQASTSDSNGQGGIRTGGDSLVADCTATSHGNDGVVVVEGSSVRGSAVRANASAGISTVGACLVAGNTASGNGGVGLLLGTGSGYLQNVGVENNGANPQVSGGSDQGAHLCVGGANGNACP